MLKKSLAAAFLSCLVVASLGAKLNAGDCCCPCPPPPQKVCICVVDPCTHCKYPVELCVPACCADEVPCYAGCRKGAFGRKILTYKWQCCGHCVEVVITKRGRTIVRD